jgi:hypothetical protein
MKVGSFYIPVLQFFFPAFTAFTASKTEAQASFSSMPTLPDYPGVSRIQTESPGPPYGSPNLPDSKESAYFGRVLAFSGENFGIFDAFLWLNQPSSTFNTVFLG